MSRIGYRNPRFYQARQTWPQPYPPKASAQAANELRTANEPSPPPDSFKAPQPPAEHGVKLLAAIREIFEARGANQLSTIAVLKALIERKGEPWAPSWERDIAMGNVRAAGAQLARLLKPFGIASHTIREPDGKHAKRL
jgi:hypothetical protein